MAIWIFAPIAGLHSGLFVMELARVVLWLSTSASALLWRLCLDWVWGAVVYCGIEVQQRADIHELLETPLPLPLCHTPQTFWPVLDIAVAIELVLGQFLSFLKARAGM